MPYHIRKEGKKWRIQIGTQKLKAHYKSKKSAQKVQRYLYAREGKKRR